LTSDDRDGRSRHEAGDGRNGDELDDPAEAKESDAKNDEAAEGGER
jgi:hypothetical protein